MNALTISLLASDGLNKVGGFNYHTDWIFERNTYLHVISYNVGDERWEYYDYIDIPLLAADEVECLINKLIKNHS